MPGEHMIPAINLEWLGALIAVVLGVWAIMKGIKAYTRGVAKQTFEEEIPAHCDAKHKELKEETSGAVRQLKESICKIDEKVDKWGEETTGVKEKVAELVGELRARRNREPV